MSASIGSASTGRGSVAGMPPAVAAVGRWCEQHPELMADLEAAEAGR